MGRAVWQNRAMDTLVEAVREADGALDEAHIRRHLVRWGEEYVDAFSPATIAAHIRGLEALNADVPVQVQWGAELEAESSGVLACTVLAYDHPGLFALITGALASVGFEVSSGAIFTSRPETSPKSPHRRPRRGCAFAHTLPPPPRRQVIDRFSGQFPGEPRDGDGREALDAMLLALARRLEGGDEAVQSEARRWINECVGHRLRQLPDVGEPILYPVDIQISNEGEGGTLLRVDSQDTPVFLYALSNGLALRGMQIERVRIETREGRARDELRVLDRNGRPMTRPERLDELRFCVLLTKQFTYFLGHAPDPYRALERFERLAEEVFRDPAREDWVRRFSDPKSLKTLARLLGASDFLWEDFIRTQYESLLPWLGEESVAPEQEWSREALAARLAQAIEGAECAEDFRKALNKWKDAEILRIDLAHVLRPGADVRALAEPLSLLAELTVGAAAAHVYAGLMARYGAPRTVGGLRAGYAIGGLGKLGGVALGYASDIELLFVYSDGGRTDGDERIDNAEFFDRFTADTVGMIEARRAGVFQVDLRLRPYGQSGPRACSLESFCRYYGPGGAALSYERLALVRLRMISGDPELGQRVERLRDEFVYMAREIKVDELQELREKQFETKVPAGRLNAKFSAGALVDLEYCVQILQIQLGGEHAELRTPRIHEALQALTRIGVIEHEESWRLNEAYYFLRNLINGLRMLRGNALDLFLPDPGSLEYLHLARRMGYRRKRDLDAGQQLLMEFETQTAVVRRFVERHFGREHVPDAGQGNLVDLILSESPGEELTRNVLGKIGVTDPVRATRNLRSLAGGETRRDMFCRLAVLAGDILRFVPDADMALNNWEHFVRSLPDAELHFGRLLLQPKRLDILLRIFATSQFLADALAHNPEFFDWVTDPVVLHAHHRRHNLLESLDLMCLDAEDDDAWLDTMRRFRRREILRIGTRDICLRIPIRVITAELSALAEAILARWTERAYASLPMRTGGPPKPPLASFCLLALGKLGGGELNYSSDIDLVAVCDERQLGGERLALKPILARLAERVRAGISRHTSEGYAYRVDFRLRPHGRSGELVPTCDSVVTYYTQRAADWEIQALLKARPVAGNRKVGAALLDALRPHVASARPLAQVAAAIQTMREAAIRVHGADGEIDVKTGVGGIRDIEFLVQGLQLVHLAAHPELFCGNTLEALERLRDVAVIPRDVADELAGHYAFLRRIEHFLQLLEDRQTHTVPRDPQARQALARRVTGDNREAAQFSDELEHVRAATREYYLRLLGIR